MQSQWDLFYGRRIGDSFAVTLRKGPWVATGQLRDSLDAAFESAEVEFNKLTGVLAKDNSDLSTLLD